MKTIYSKPYTIRHQTLQTKNQIKNIIDKRDTVNPK